MTRRKREIVGLANEQDFPHLVELALPPGGPDRTAGAGRQAMTKKHRLYQPRMIGGKVMLQADLEPLHKYMLAIERQSTGHTATQSMVLQRMQLSLTTKVNSALQTPLRRATLAKKVVPYTQQSEPVLFLLRRVRTETNKK